MTLFMSLMAGLLVDIMLGAVHHWLPSKETATEVPAAAQRDALDLP